MKAMILSAGRGERMRPLTDTCPKPMLTAGGEALMVRHIRALAAAGISDIVINHAWLGNVICRGLGDGSAWGVRLHFSAEPEGGLETAGGIAQALPWLGEVFLVVNGDVFVEKLPVRQALARAQRLPENVDAHLWLTDNPPHHPQGDFVLEGDRLTSTGTHTKTFAGIGIYRARLFDGIRTGERAPLAPLLRRAMDIGRVSGSLLAGAWEDVGTPERLESLRRRLLPMD